MSSINSMSRKNDFVHVQLRDNGRPVPMLRAVCSRCQAEGDVKISSGSITCDQSFAERMFRNKKWQLGKNREQDVCPECVALSRRKPSAEEPTKFEQAEAKTLLEQLNRRPEVSEATKKLLGLYFEPILGWTPEMLALARSVLAGALHTTSSGCTGFIPGYSEARVTAELLELPEFKGLKEKTVSALRVALYGSARKMRDKAITPDLEHQDQPEMMPPPSQGAGSARLAAVEARIRGLEERIQEVEDREDELRGVVLKLTANLGAGASTHKLIAALKAALDEL